MKNENEVGPDYSKEDMAVKREDNMKVAPIKDKRETLELWVNHQFWGWDWRHKRKYLSLHCRGYVEFTEYYEAFDAEQIQLRPRSLEEELKACKEQMLNVKEDLKAAHEKVKTSDN